MTGNILNAAALDLGDARIVPFSQALTNAQIKALPTTGFDLVAAQGSGYAILPIAAVMVMRFSAGAYTNVDAAAYLRLALGADDGYAFSYLPNDAAITNPTVTATLLSTLFGAANKIAQFVPFGSTENLNYWGIVGGFGDLADIDNRSLNIKINNAAAGNLTGGNVANTAKVVGAAMIVKLT